MTAFPGVHAFIFDLGWGELIIIGVVALVAIGPKELPAAMRTAGQWMGKLRRMAAEFQNQFQEAMREAEVADLKRHFDAIEDAAKDIHTFDPVGPIPEGARPGDTSSAVSSLDAPPEPIPTITPPVTSPARGDAAERAGAESAESSKPDLTRDPAAPESLGNGRRG